MLQHKTSLQETNTNQSLFVMKITRFCFALHGLDTRRDIQEPGMFSYMELHRLFALRTRFGYRQLSKSRASLFVFAGYTRGRARFGQQEKQVLVLGKAGRLKVCW